MFSLAHIIYGLLAIGVGIISIKYNYQLVGYTGRQDWIESKLGGGSTYFFYKLVSVVLIFGGILYATGLGEPFFTWFLSPLRGLFPTAPSN